MLVKVTEWQHYKFLFTHLKKFWVNASHEITSVYFNLTLNIGNRNKNIIEINVLFSAAETVSDLHLWRCFYNLFFGTWQIDYLCFSDTDQTWTSEREMNLPQFLIRWKDFLCKTSFLLLLRWEVGIFTFICHWVKFFSILNENEEEKFKD